jgi:putative ATPase
MCIRDSAVSEAKKIQFEKHKRTILFVDEVHRFNKSQQDAFLPHVEDGTVYFIGATTENPSFALNNALLSRARVYVLNALSSEELLDVLNKALNDSDKGLGGLDIAMADDIKQQFAEAADGDARRLLNLLEIAVELAAAKNSHVINEACAREVLSGGVRRFDNQGEEFYNQISALHKSVRGSSPDASLYWLCRMMDGGCDLSYLARRIVRIASEDIGNADPRALQVAINAWEAQERLGSPEGELALAQAIIYLACAPKSNAVYTAYNAAMSDAKQSGSLGVPVHLRNAPTKLMKELGYGDEYQYSHNYANNFSEQEYLPDAIKETKFYDPGSNSRENGTREFLKNRWKDKYGY